jgi:shikimate dehydrogenase
MTAAPPLVIVTLPARTVAGARSEALLAAEHGADLAEVRVDRLPADEQQKLPELFPPALPLVATLRSRAEGGEGPDDPAARAEVLQRLAALPFRWIDVEFARDLPAVLQLPPPERLGRIVSSHLRQGEQSGWERRWRELATVDAVGKLVFPASVPLVLREVLPALAGRPGGGCVVQTTGPSGPLLRALAGRLRFPFVYAALPEGASGAPVEPSQIPVDQLRPFLDAEGSAPLFAIVGRPVDHSASPAIHARWMRAARRPGIYLPLEFPDDLELVESLPRLAELGFRGLNVTHPFKAAAAEAATDLRPGALASRAANCLSFRAGGIEAENTDLAAILRRLGELRLSGAWEGSELAVVGAGGSARATLAAARTLAVPATVYARRPEAARSLAAEFEATAGGGRREAPHELVVHATSAGRKGAGPLAVPLAPLLGPKSHVVDWVYRPDAPEVQAAARSAGATYEDGWRLLVYQAAASFEIWWGSSPGDAPVAEALAEGGCAA